MAGALAISGSTAFAMVAHDAGAHGPEPSRERADENLCGMADVDPDHFVDSYAMEVGAGFVSNGQVSMPAPTTDTDTVTIFTMDGALALSDSAGTIDAEVAGADEPVWEWPAGVGKPPVDSDETALLAGCENDELPRLTASGTGTSADGKALQYGYRLVEVQPGFLVGVLSWEGGGFHSKRWVTLERSES